jgi:hypothetical protein
MKPSALAGIDESDHRHDRLLRARRERPRGRRAAKNCDELAALQLIELHSILVSYGQNAGYRSGADQSGRFYNLLALSGVSELGSDSVIRQCPLNVRFTRKRTQVGHRAMSA